MYADNMTDSMKKAIDETKRRRSIQQEYNDKNHIIPHTVIKEIKAPETLSKNVDLMKDYLSKDKKVAKKSTEELIASLTKEMKEAAKNLDFEQAATLRDIILELKSELSS